MPYRALSLPIVLLACCGLSVSAAGEDLPLLSTAQLLSHSPPGAVIDNRAFVPSSAARAAPSPSTATSSSPKR